jgi:hypothetical protein
MIRTTLTVALAMANATAAISRPATDDAHWREDIAVARTEFLARDLSYSDADRERAKRKLDALAANVPTLTDQEIGAELARTAALAGNAHTRAYLLRNRGWWRRYPIRIWHFSDGWRVIAVRPGQEKLLGGKIEAIGGRRIDAAAAAVKPLYPGNDAWATYMASYTLTSPDALLGVHLIRGGGETMIRVRKGERVITDRLVPVDAPRRQIPEESWWFLAPDHTATSGWVSAIKDRPLPEYLKQPNSWYDLRQCAGGILYLPFTRAEDQQGRLPLQEFSRVVAEILERANAKSRLVVDLRFNTGGDLTKSRSLFEALAKGQFGQTRGRLYVILGPSTFSAGITPAAILKQSSKAIFVGSAPGDEMRFWAEGGNIVLPNSGLTLHYANGAHIYSPGGPPVAEDRVALRLNAAALTPDRPASPSWADYAAGRDVAANTIARGGLHCS